MYRLSIEIGTTFTSARCERAEESEALRLSSFARDLPSAQFVTGGEVQLDSLAETLRGIVDTATEELGEHPGSVEVTYPASWESGQLLLLWEALVLAGIPDAATRPVADPEPTTEVQLSPADYGERRTALVPAPAAADVAARTRTGWRRKRVWLVAAALVSVASGVTVGVIATGAPQTVRTGEDPHRNQAARLSGSPLLQPRRPRTPRRPQMPA